MTTDTQNQYNTSQMGCGRVIKVKMLKTSEEVKQARIREREQKRDLAIRQKYQTMQETMLQAVEQAVALPEMPKREKVEDIDSSSHSQPTKKCREIPSLKAQAEKVMGSIASWMDRMRVLVLEEG